MKKKLIILSFLLLTQQLLAFTANNCAVINTQDEIDESRTQIKTEDIRNDKSKENMEKWLNAEFGLQPYRTNYLLPFGIASREYVSNIPDTKYKNIEAELQVSLKLKVADNLFGLHEKYYLSYTQQAFWQIYVYSSPFRENLYNPEGFVVFPIRDNYSIFQLRSLKVAVAHKSNGQPDTTNVTFSDGSTMENLSKSINYFYTTVRLQHNTIISDFTLLAPFPGSDNLSDNPDLMDYLGYAQMKLTYFLNAHMMSCMVRGNPKTRKGALEITYSHPHPHNDSTYWYAKLFSGYVESLIDYKRNITKFSIGFAFSR
jgi:phospholipase A1